MAKKSRRARAVSRNGVAPQSVENTQPQELNQVATTRKSSRQPVAASVNVMQDGYYDYVKSDLIRIGIISAALIIILIILTFIPALNT